MYFINNRRIFETLTEAKLELIRILSSEPNTNFPSFLDDLMLSIEQHTGKEELLNLIEQYTTNKKNLIPIDIIDAIKELSNTEFSTNLLNQQPTIAAQDSFMSAELLLHPTQKMRETRDKITQVVVLTLNKFIRHRFQDSGRDLKPHICMFAQYMIFEQENTYPGLFTLNEVNSRLTRKKINKDDIGTNGTPDKTVLNTHQVKQILMMVIERLESANTPNYQILAIHNRFAYYLLKRVKLESVDDKQLPTGSPVYQKIIEAYNTMHGTNLSFDAFFAEMRNPSLAGDLIRAFISDDMMFRSALYTVESERGRKNPDPKVVTSHLGIMRHTNDELRQGLPVLSDQTPWVDWAKCGFIPHSKIVNSMVRNETPFISSFSGSISLAINLALSAGLTTEEEQLAYLCLSLGYICGSGYHSLHEVLAPAAWCIGLLKEEVYPVEVPTSPSHYLPPQYGSFYQYMEKIDPEFKERRVCVWKRINDWYQNVYREYYISPRTETLIQDVLANYVSSPPEKRERLIEVMKVLGMDNLTPHEKLHLTLSIHALLEQPNTSSLFERLKKVLIESNAVAEAIKNQEQLSAALLKLNCAQSLFSIRLLDNNNLLIFSRPPLSASGYTLCPTPLNDSQEKLRELLRCLQLQDNEIDTVFSNLTDDSFDLILPAPLQLKAIQVLSSETSNLLALFDWNKWVQEEIHSKSNLQIIKEDPSRQRIIVRDEERSQIRKYIAIRLDCLLEEQAQQQNKFLFTLVNPAAHYEFHVKENFISVHMTDLGIPLIEFIRDCSPLELEEIKIKAREIINKIHSAGYVHGDISMANFVYNPQMKSLHIIDFETAKPCHDYIALPLFSNELMIGLDPQHFSMSDDLILLDRMFTEIDKLVHTGNPSVGASI